MYTTCLFCMRPLGANEVLEQFPVGRRIAFDAEKGRLWVVCPHCERWNLTPVEERWEAIEQAERLYRDTRLRVATDNIGLARLPEGLELVRIGRPQRPEIAAWRYGDQFGRRRRKHLLTVGGLAIAGGALLAGGAVAGLSTVILFNAGRFGWGYVTGGWPASAIARFRDEDGALLRVRRHHLSLTMLRMGSNGGLALDLAHDGGFAMLEGRAARQASARLFSALNRAGGNREEVQSAVGRLERAGDAERFIAQIARRAEKLTRTLDRKARRYPYFVDTREYGLHALSGPLSLAIEMALHEDQERRALEGELAELEQAWREAEEIGAIADALLLPAWVDDAMKRLRSTHA